MLAYTLIVIFAVSILHLVWESMVAPTIRIAIQTRLMNLRKELRDLKIPKGNEIAVKHHKALESSLNFFLSSYSRLDLLLLVQVSHQLASDPELKQQTEDRAKELQSCTDPKIRSLRKSMFEQADVALFANSGAWAIYLIPIGIAIVSFRIVNKALIRMLSLPASANAKFDTDINTVIRF